MTNNLKNRLKAGVNIEIALSIVLAVIVLALILGLFSNNIKKLFESSNFTRVLTKSGTDVVTYDRDYTNSQVNVGIVADPDALLAQVHQSAKDAIRELSQLPQPLSDEDKMNLALQLTLLANSADMSPREVLKIPDPEIGIPYKDLGLQNGVTTDFDQRGYGKYLTNVELESGVKNIPWADESLGQFVYDGSNSGVSEEVTQKRLDLIKSIKKAFLE